MKILISGKNRLGKKTFYTATVDGHPEVSGHGDKPANAVGDMVWENLRLFGLTAESVKNVATDTSIDWAMLSEHPATEVYRRTKTI